MKHNVALPPFTESCGGKKVAGKQRGRGSKKMMMCLIQISG